MIISADRILQGAQESIIENGAVYIADGIIKMVDRLEKVQAAYPDEPVERYPGATIMPGMIDLHVHLGCPFDPAYSNPYNGVSMRALQTAGRMADTLAAGVTTVRDSASGDGIGTALKQAAADGYIKSPRIVTCLQGICMTGGHGSTLSTMGSAIIEADGVNEIRKAVRFNLKNGADCIKVLTSEGYRGQEFNQEELDAAVEEAHRFGVKIAAHAGYGESIEMCIKAGFDSIEHGTHLTTVQAQYMKEHNITWVPTIFVFNYIYEQVRKKSDVLGEHMQKQECYLADSVESYRENLRELYDTGVRVATGTDIEGADYQGGAPVALECAYMVKCGLTPLEAIECATKNGADYLGLGDRLGQIKSGYIADIILVKGNPDKVIDALTDITAVFQSGKKVFG